MTPYKQQPNNEDSVFAFILVALLLMLPALLVYKIYENYYGSGKEEKRCGAIIEKGKEEPTSGYKSHRDAVYYVIMRTPEGAVRVNTTVPTYYRLEVGSMACFDLSEIDLKQMGN